MGKHMSGEAEIEMEVETSVNAEVETNGEGMVETWGEATIKNEFTGEDEPKFTKGQILNSKKYCNSKDILTALLTEGEKYTHSEVSRITEGFMKGEIQ